MDLSDFCTEFSRLESWRCFSFLKRQLHLTVFGKSRSLHFRRYAFLVYSPPQSRSFVYLLPLLPESLMSERLCQLKATFHLTISVRGQRATGKIQRNNYHHGSCGSSLTGKTMSVFLIFTQGTHRNVKNR